MGPIKPARARSLGMSYEAVSDATILDIKQAKQAERAKRIVESEVWAKDLFPILVMLHDRYLEDVKAKRMDVDTLKVFDDIMTAIDGSIQIGANAMLRMAERRLKNAKSLEQIKEVAV